MYKVERIFTVFIDFDYRKGMKLFFIKIFFVL